MPTAYGFARNKLIYGSYDQIQRADAVLLLRLTMVMAWRSILLGDILSENFIKYYINWYISTDPTA